jgi:hypothetical protein
MAVTAQEKKAARRPRVVKTVTTETIEAAPAADDPGNEKPFAEIEDTRDYTGYDKSLKSYMHEFGMSDANYTAVLFKYDPIIKQKQYVCDSRTNEMLSQHDIGMSFGGGEYRYLVTFDDEKIKAKAFKINLHKCYDEYREKAGLVSPGGNGHGGNGKSNLAETIEIMKTIFEMIKPLFPQQSAAPALAPSTEIFNAYGMMKDILRKNLNENMDLINEVIRGRIDGQGRGGEMETEVEEAQPDIVDRILPLIEKFAPMIMGNNLQSKITVEAVKALPEFKNLMKNAGDLKNVVDAVEKKIGKAETDKILTKLKVSRPA